MVFWPEKNKLLELLRNRLPGGCVWLSLGSVPIAEVAANCGADAVVLDCQHGLWDGPSLYAAIGLINSTSVSVVRVKENSSRAIGEPLDAGAQGVIVPMIESRKDAEMAVSYARLPPVGKRSGGGVRPLFDFDKYRRFEDSEIFVAIMIETESGLENLEEILSVPGIDMVFIGPGDLKLSLGRDDIRTEIKEILRQCRRQGVACGNFTLSDADIAEFCLDGGDFLVLKDDLSVLKEGFTKVKGQLAKLR